MRLPNTFSCIVFVLALINTSLLQAHPGHQDGEYDTPKARKFFQSVFNDVRNIYTEPNSGIGSQSINEFGNEYINPFSGLLQLKYVDINVSANGPDILAQRNYLGIQPHQFDQMTAMQRSVNGLGWQMHFGKLVSPSFNNASLCESPVMNPATELQVMVDAMLADLQSGSIRSAETLQARIQTLRNLLSQRVLFSDQELLALQPISKKGVHDINAALDDVNTETDAELYDLNDIIPDNETSSTDLVRFFIDLLEPLALDYTTSDSVAFELPDGGRFSFFRDDVSGAENQLLSMNLFQLRCVGTDMVVFSPDGTQYFMTEYENFIGQRQPSEHANWLHWGEHSWYVSRIEDVHGNNITVDYQENSKGIKYITSARSSDTDTQPIDFTYENIDTDLIKLESISSGIKTWTYSYQQVTKAPVETGDAVTNFNVLHTVTRPDQRTITYWHDQSTYELETITTAYGVNINYKYQDIDILPNFSNVSDGYKLYSALDTKVLSGAGIATENWSFSFDPASVNLDGFPNYDISTVTSPISETKYYHIGGALTAEGDNLIYWGTSAQSTFAASDKTSTINQDTSRLSSVHSWDTTSVELSSQNYVNGSSLADYVAISQNRIPELPPEGGLAGAKLPVLLSEGAAANWDISKLRGVSDLHYGVLYDNFDEYGFPKTITELQSGFSSSNGADRSHQIAYSNDLDLWVLGLPELETISNGSESYTVSRGYTAKQQLETLTRAGVTTDFVYYEDGALKSVTDANDNTTNYGPSRNGIPTSIKNAENENTLFDISTAGTIRKITDPEGRDTSYIYDAFDRATSITPPINAVSIIEYEDTNNERTTTRDGLVVKETFDVKGRLISSDVGGVITTYGYDVLNRNTFISNPSSSDGTSLTYDALDRLTTQTDPAGQVTSYNYSESFNEVSVTNKRNFITTSKFMRLGFEQILSSTKETIEGDEFRLTSFLNNIMGVATVIAQTDKNGYGLSREFEFDSRFFIDKKYEPEIGYTDYGTDNVGNVTSSSVSANGLNTSYHYDKANRLVGIDYPSNTDDITYKYFPDGQLETVQTGTIIRNYQYDFNNNLRRETLDIAGRFQRQLTLDYTYNSRDQLQTIQYPNQAPIDYSPDALGRATKVGAYASNVSFTAAGQLESLSLANGKVRTITYDSRLQPSTISTPGVVGLGYNYDPMGNVGEITNSVNATQNVSFSGDAYDGIDRLKSITAFQKLNEPNRLVEHQYNALGDLLKIEIDTSNRKRIRTHRSNAMLRNIKEKDSNEPDISLDYDAYGAVTNKRSFRQNSGNNDFAITNSHFNFDDASRLISVESSTVAGKDKTKERSYRYDGHNQRTVSEIPNSYDVNYSFYSMSGELMYEESVKKCQTINNIRLGSSLLARQVKQSEDPDLDTDSDSLDDCLETIVGLNLNDASDASADSDGDGISNADELLIYGSLIDNPDSDGDGVSDGEERDRGTDLNDSDTDGDGLDDAQEIALGLDPTQRDTDHDGVNDKTEHETSLNPLDGADGVFDLDLDGWSNRQEDLLRFDVGNSTSQPVDSGLRKWTFDGFGRVLSAPTISLDKTIYYATGRGNVYAVNPDGTLKWEYKDSEGWGIYGAVVVDEANQAVYFGISSGDVVALNFDGTVKWIVKGDPNTSTRGITSSLTIDEDGNIYFLTRAEIYSLTPAGERRWKKQLHSTSPRIRSRISMTNNGVLIVPGSGLAAFDADSGDELWEVFFTGHDFREAAPAIVNNNLVIISDKGTLFKIKGSDGSEVWSQILPTFNDVSFTIFSSPVVDPDGNIYVGTTLNEAGERGGSLFKVGDDGVTLWNKSLFGTPSTPSIAADGTVYIADYAGLLHAFNSDGSVQWINRDFADNTFNSPMIDEDGTIYLAFENGALHSYTDNSGGLAASWSSSGNGQAGSANQCANGHGFYSSVDDSDGDLLHNCFEITTEGFDENDASDGNMDEDGDGLTRGEEFQLGTDHTKADTDGDGLSDGDEVEIYGTNPLSTDTDRDGVSDGDEVDNGTDPNDPTGAGEDSDGDGFSNRQELLAGTDPFDGASKPDNGHHQWSVDSVSTNSVGIAVTEEQIVIEAFASGLLRSVNSFGEIRWVTDVISQEGDGITRPPVLDAGTGILLLTQRELVKVDLESGQELFRSDYDHLDISSTQNVLALGANGTSYIGYSVATNDHASYIKAMSNAGQELWSTSLPLELNEIRKIAVDGYGRVRVSASTGFAILQPSDGAILLAEEKPDGSSFAFLTRDARQLSSDRVNTLKTAIVNLSAGGELLLRDLPSDMTVTGMTDNQNLIAQGGNSSNGYKRFIVDLDGTLITEFTIGTGDQDMLPIVLSSSNELIASRNSVVSSFDQSGATNWTASVDGSNANQHIIGQDGTIYIANSLGLHAFASDTGSLSTSLEAWPTPLHDNSNSNNVCHSAGQTYAADGDADADGISDCVEYLAGLDMHDASDAALDLDGDGLSNLDEFQLETSVFNADTDGDGLNDGDELNVHNTDPNTFDSDDDGLGDGYEIDNDLNPNDASAELLIDSDGDGYSNRQERVALTNAVDSNSVPEDGQIVFSFARNGLDGISDSETTATLNIYSAAAAQDAQSNIYIGDTDGRFVSLDVHGALRWSFDAPNPILASAALDSQGNVYFIDVLSNLYSLDSTTGAVNWQLPFEHRGDLYTYSVAIGKDHIYAVGIKGELHAINYDGDIVWTQLTSGTPTSSPLVDADGTIYTTSLSRLATRLSGTLANTSRSIFSEGQRIWSGSLRAYAPTGSLKWELPNLGRAFTRPAISDDGHLYIGTFKGFHKLTNTGQVVWKINRAVFDTDHNGSRSFKSPVSNMSPVIDPQGYVYIVIDDKVWKLHPENGNIVWERSTSTHGAQPVMSQNGSVLLPVARPISIPFGPQGFRVQRHSSEGVPYGFGLNATTARSLNLAPADGLMIVSTRDGIVGLTFGGGKLATNGWPGELVDAANSGNKCSYLGGISGVDSDQDGLSDCFERSIGLNPDDSLDASSDLDADGLSNLDEFLLGSYPLRADSDLDGVSDFDEVNIRSTNPVHNDSDADGLTDGFELASGLNPLIATERSLDSDSDGFSNLQEALGGYSPIDPNSHPEIGEILWSYNTDMLLRPIVTRSPTSSPVGLDDGSVAYLSENRLNYFSPLGEMKWHLDGAWNHLSASEHIYLVGRRFGAAGEHDEVIVLDKMGNEVWNRVVSHVDLGIADGEVVLSQISIESNQRVYVTAKSEEARFLLQLNENGEIQWIKTISESTSAFPDPVPPAIRQDRAVLVAVANQVLAVNHMGETVWEFTLAESGFLERIEELAIADNGKIVAITRNNATYLTASGEFESKVPASQIENNHAAHVGGSVLDLRVPNINENAGCRVFSDDLICSDVFRFEGNQKNSTESGAKISDAGLVFFLTNNAWQTSFQSGSRLHAVAVGDTRAADNPWPMQGQNFGESRAANDDYIEVAPTVRILSPTVTQQPSSTTIVFQASAYDFVEGDVAEQAIWVSDIDGEFGTGSELFISSLSSGTHQISVSVTDSDGSVGSDSITINIGGEPNVTITSPTDYAALNPQVAISLTALASDNEDGDLSGVIQWSSDEDGALGSGSPITHLFSDGPHKLTASVTDSDGSQNTHTIQIYINVDASLIDSDGDGMPDFWEQQHNLDFTSSLDRLSDSDGDGFSNLIEYLGQSDPTLMMSVPVSNYYIQSSDQASSDLVGVSLGDGNSLNLSFFGNQGIVETEQLFSIQNNRLFQSSVLTATNMVTVTSSLNGTDLPSNNFLVGTQFSALPVRGSHNYYIHNPSATVAAEVNYRAGNSFSSPFSLGAGSFTNLSAGSVNGVAALIESDFPIAVVHQGSSAGVPQDVYAVPPASTDLWGIQSGARIGALHDGTVIDVYASNGQTEQITLDRGEVGHISIGESTDASQGSALHLIANKPVGAIQYDDSDGTESTAFFDSAHLATLYGLPLDTQYVAVVCVMPNTAVTLRNTQGLFETTLCEANGRHPGKSYFSVGAGEPLYAAGTILEASEPVYIVYESNVGDDERNALGRFAIPSANINNSPPILTLIDPVAGSVSSREPGNILLRAAANDAEQGNISDTISWISSLDGPLGTGGELVADIASLGTHEFTATVSDSEGIEVSQSATINFDQKPELSINSPSNDAQFEQADSIDFSASASDLVDGDLGAQINWRSNRAGQLGIGSNLTIDAGTLATGKHFVSASVTDSNDLEATSSVSVFINEPPANVDTVAPTVTAPEDIVIEATQVLSVIDIGTATATDDTDGSIPANADNLGPFPLGITQVVWSAVDAAGNLGTDIQTVVVTDTTAPTISAPADIEVASDEPTPVGLGNPVTADIFSTNISNNAPALFSLGVTTVTWVVTDTSGNTAQATQVVTIVPTPDVIAPVVTAPADISVEATALQTSVALGNATANDDRDGSLSATADNAGPFAIGQTTVVWSASDSSGNLGTDNQLVTITDTTPPAIKQPSSIEVESPVAIAISLDTPFAFDIFSVNVSNNAPTLFQVGVTEVVWTATDANGNTAQVNQTVTVNTPPVNVVADLISPVNGSTLSSDTETFVWQDIAADQYQLLFGTGPNLSDIGSVTVLTGITESVFDELPVDGSAVYLTIIATKGGLTGSAGPYEFTAVDKPLSDGQRNLVCGVITGPTGIFSNNACDNDRDTHVVLRSDMGNEMDARASSLIEYLKISIKPGNTNPVWAEPARDYLRVFVSDTDYADGLSYADYQALEDVTEYDFSAAEPTFTGESPAYNMHLQIPIQRQGRYLRFFYLHPTNSTSLIRINEARIKVQTVRTVVDEGVCGLITGPTSVVTNNVCDSERATRVSLHSGLSNEMDTRASSFMEYLSITIQPGNTNPVWAEPARSYLRAFVSDTAYAPDLSYDEYRALADVSEYDFSSAEPTFTGESPAYDMHLRIPVQRQGRYVRFFFMEPNSGAVLRITEARTQVRTVVSLADEGVCGLISSSTGVVTNNACDNERATHALLRSGLGNEMDTRANSLMEYLSITIQPGNTNPVWAQPARAYLRAFVSDTAYADGLSYADYQALADVTEYDFSSAEPTFTGESPTYNMHLRIPIQRQGRYVRFFFTDPNSTAVMRITEVRVQVRTVVTVADEGVCGLIAGPTGVVTNNGCDDERATQVLFTSGQGNEVDTRASSLMEYLSISLQAGSTNPTWASLTRSHLRAFVSDTAYEEGLSYSEYRALADVTEYDFIGAEPTFTGESPAYNMHLRIPIQRQGRYVRFFFMHPTNSGAGIRITEARVQVRTVVTVADEGVCGLISGPTGVVTNNGCDNERATQVLFASEQGNEMDTRASSLMEYLSITIQPGNTNPAWADPPRSYLRAFVSDTAYADGLSYAEYQTLADVTEYDFSSAEPTFTGESPTYNMHLRIPIQRRGRYVRFFFVHPTSSTAAMRITEARVQVRTVFDVADEGVCGLITGPTGVVSNNACDSQRLTEILATSGQGNEMDTGASSLMEYLSISIKSNNTNPLNATNARTFLRAFVSDTAYAPGMSYGAYRTQTDVTEYNFSSAEPTFSGASPNFDMHLRIPIQQRGRYVRFFFVHPTSTTAGVRFSEARVQVGTVFDVANDGVCGLITGLTGVVSNNACDSQRLTEILATSGQGNEMDTGASSLMEYLSISIKSSNTNPVWAQPARSFLRAFVSDTAYTPGMSYEDYRAQADVTEYDFSSAEPTFSGASPNFDMHLRIPIQQKGRYVRFFFMHPTSIYAGVRFSEARVQVRTVFDVADEGVCGLITGPTGVASNNACDSQRLTEILATSGQSNEMDTRASSMMEYLSISIKSGNTNPLNATNARLFLRAFVSDTEYAPGMSYDAYRAQADVTEYNFSSAEPTFSGASPDLDMHLRIPIQQQGRYVRFFFMYPTSTTAGIRFSEARVQVGTVFDVADQGICGLITGPTSVVSNNACDNQRSTEILATSGQGNEMDTGASSSMEYLSISIKSSNINPLNATNARRFLRAFVSDTAYADGLSYDDYRAQPDVTEYDFGSAEPTFSGSSPSFDMHLRIPVQQQGRYVRFFFMHPTSIYAGIRFSEARVQVGVN